MISHFIIFLIPISIIFTFLLFYIHLKFYDRLFRFNYYKAVKEEFLDHFITEMDDINSELEIFLIKESYLDIEDLLFFEVYFRELSSIGVLDNSSESFFPEIHYSSENTYSSIDRYYKKVNLGYQYTISSEEAEYFIDKRNDSLKEFAKFYFYIFPIINFKFFFSGITIDNTYLIAYEFDDKRNIINEELFFSYPKISHPFNPTHNFFPSHGYLSPIVSKNNYANSKIINDTYYLENILRKHDFNFRNLVDLNGEGMGQIYFGHMNYEANGNITKDLLATMQLNINRENRHFMVSILFSFNQRELIDDIAEYSTFIVRNESENHNCINEKYSDNNTFVLDYQDFTEYSLSTLNTKLFHYGLYDKNYNFHINGVSFDSFNLNCMFDPIKYYSTVEGFKFDLKYLSAFFLYFKMFQNLEFSKYKKEGEEIDLNIFSEEQKIKFLCKEINMTKYIEYIKSNTNIDCWDSQNILYYSDEYKDSVLFDTYTSIPQCECLPLYCLNNYKTLKKNKYKFSENNLASQIYLPNKCQNKLIYYINENDPKLIQSYSYFYKFMFYLFNSEARIPESQYIKIDNQKLIQMPGYYLLSFSEIHSNSASLFYTFYNIYYKIEILFINFIFFFFIFIISIVIIYKNLKKYSLIIDEFTEKYEKFIYHSACNDISLLHQEENKNINHLYNNNIEKKNNALRNEEDLPFLKNNALINELYDTENYLIEDLFQIYFKYYNISQKNLEKYYLKKTHETKYQMNIKMMTEKNELFKLLCLYSIYAPHFRLNLSLDYKMYKYSTIIKKYDQYVDQVSNFDKEQMKLTKNILYELLSTENLSDYGLVMNLNFKYISNINADIKENSIQNALFKNVINKIKGNKINNNEEEEESEMNYNDIFFYIKDGDEKRNVKLILKKKNELMEVFKNKFENDDYLDINKIESSFNFFLINSYYKYLKQISFENNNT